MSKIRILILLSFIILLTVSALNLEAQTSNTVWFTLSIQTSPATSVSYVGISGTNQNGTYSCFPNCTPGVLHPVYGNFVKSYSLTNYWWRAGRTLTVEFDLYLDTNLNIVYRRICEFTIPSDARNGSRLTLTYTGYNSSTGTYRGSVMYTSTSGFPGFRTVTCRIR